MKTISAMAAKLRATADELDRLGDVKVPPQTMTIGEAFAAVVAIIGDEYSSIGMEITRHAGGRFICEWKVYDSVKGAHREAATLAEAVEKFVAAYHSPEVKVEDVEAALGLTCAGINRADAPDAYAHS